MVAEGENRRACLQRDVTEARTDEKMETCSVSMSWTWRACDLDSESSAKISYSSEGRSKCADNCVSCLALRSGFASRGRGWRRRRIDITAQGTKRRAEQCDNIIIKGAKCGSEVEVRQHGVA